jgi:hypothetical protein
VTGERRGTVDPSDEEIAAAVTALIAVLARRSPPVTPRRRPTWADPVQGFRRPMAPAPGAWHSPAGLLR